MNETILIIEDNDDMRQNTAEILTLASYHVLTASNGKEGVALAIEQPPDLILCDITMPELDGYGVIRALENSEKLSAIPFIFITARSEKDDFRKGMDLGADDYLTKPFNGEDLLRVVAARLKRSKGLKRHFQHNLAGLSEFITEARTIADLKNLSEHRSIRKLSKKSVLFTEGEHCHFLYFLVSGKIKTSRSNKEGKEFIRQIYKEGDFIGYIALLNNDRRHRESAIAIEDAEVMLIPRDDFYKLVYSNHEVSIEFIKFLTNNLADAQEKLLQLAYDSARKRVAEALLLLQRKYQSDENDNSPFPAHRDNIAALAGVSPESSSRNLKEFREEGLIETYSNATVRILDLKKLENMRN